MCKCEAMNKNNDCVRKMALNEAALVCLQSAIYWRISATDERLSERVRKENIEFAHIAQGLASDILRLK
jgi:hypothetical protein